MFGNFTIIVLLAHLHVLLLGAGDESGAVWSDVLASLSALEVLGLLEFDFAHVFGLLYAFLFHVHFHIIVDLTGGVVDETLDISIGRYLISILVSTEPKCAGGTEESSDKEDSGVHCFFVLFVVFIEVSQMPPFICHIIAENGLFPRNYYILTAQN